MIPDLSRFPPAPEVDILIGSACPCGKCGRPIEQFDALYLMPLNGSRTTRISYCVKCGEKALEERRAALRDAMQVSR